MEEKEGGGAFVGTKRRSGRKTTEKNNFEMYIAKYIYYFFYVVFPMSSLSDKTQSKIKVKEQNFYFSYFIFFDRPHGRSGWIPYMFDNIFFLNLNVCF